MSDLPSPQENAHARTKALRIQAENARLKAEVERLDTLCKQLGKQHSDISCENIMLRKAGDEMYMTLVDNNSHFEQVWRDKRFYAREVFQGWQAAKEGKPSETNSPSFIEDLGNGVEKHDLLFRCPAKEGKPSV